MEIIKSKSGTRIRLGKTQLRSVTGGCHDFVFKLSNLREGYRKGILVATQVSCLFSGSKRGQAWYVSFKRRAIGCQDFDTATWAKIVRAAKKVQS